MLKKIFVPCLMLLPGLCGLAQQSLPSYNIVWDKPSANASESMPCGGGDIGMNVWVENGDLLIYVARSGNFDENNALLKTGRIRIRFDINPFTGANFRQELHLQKGHVTVHGGVSGKQVSVTIWADPLHPSVHITMNSQQPVEAEVIYESWRYQDRILQSRENFGNSFKWAAPKNNIGRGDNISFTGNNVRFYHKNRNESIFDLIVAQQGLEAVKDSLYNPLKDLIFGGSLYGENFVASGVTDGIYASTDFKGWKIVSKKAARSQAVHLALHNNQTKDISSFNSGLDSVERVAGKRNLQHSVEWWAAFWKRSFIAIAPDRMQSKEWEIGRNYQLFRYMLACNTNGIWPTKFNGGLLTVDPEYTDAAHKLTPDYRNWGGGLHTMQNQRLVYFPMVRSGDWDMLQAQLLFYERILKNAELRTEAYWGHGGASFTEQMENFGLPNYAEYGQGRPADFDKGLEYNAWLEYMWDTVFEFCLMMLEEERYTGRDIRNRLPFINSCLNFFDQHYQMLAGRRGRQKLDGSGKLILYPGSGAETFKMANNASSTIAALQVVTDRLISLPDGYAADTMRRKWIDLRKRIPEIPFTVLSGHQTIAPAVSWERINNTESPQLYPVYPWGIFGIGKPGFETALNTWKYDTNVIKFRSHIGWKQDNIWAARLGLTEEAWRLTSLKLQNSPRRFPSFWGPGFDWVPDHNWGGSGMIGLQEMLLQSDDRRILLFPAWPRQTDVHFKLHLPYKTTIEVSLRNGKIEQLIVTPKEREADVVNMLR